MALTAPGNGLLCPYCVSVMQTMHQGKVQLDVCIACGTRWFDRTELAALVDEVAPDAVLGWGERPDKDDVHHNCPRCRTPSLAPYRFGAVGFRRCDTCRGVAISSEDLDVLFRAVSGPGSRLVGIVKELFGG